MSTEALAAPIDQAEFQTIERLPVTPPRDGEARWVSIDALRGFNMLAIIGVNTLIYKLHEIYATPVTAALDHQFRHPQWDEGFTFYDLIWPLFLFIVGTVIPVSLERRKKQGQSTKQLYSYIARRTLVVFFVGVLMTGPLTYDLSRVFEVTWWGVLQRIAVCYFVAAVLVIHTGWRTQAVISTAILLGYWAALMLLEIGGMGPGVSAKSNCWVYAFGLPDNFVTTPLSLPSVLLGVWAGQWLRSRRSEQRRIGGLVLAGVALVVVGYVWALWFPMIKRIWSSTYVVYAGGWSLLLLALFHWVIDVKGYKKWAFFVIVIGMNAIPIYFLTNSPYKAPHDLVDFEWIAGLFLQGLMNLAGVVTARPVVLIAGALVVKWLFLWFLYKHKLFFRA
jgi:predicted acyltransferase